MNDEMKRIEDVTFEEKIEGYIVNPATGNKVACEFSDLTDEERRKVVELEERADEGDEEAAEKLEELVIGEYFHSDKITPDSPLAQKQAVLAGFLRALGADNAVTQDAREMMERLDQQGK